DDAVAHAHDGPLPAAPQPQVPPVHEELDAVLLRRDGVALGAGEQPHAVGLHLDPAHLPLVGADGAGDLEGALLRGLLGRAERGPVHGPGVDDALDDPGAVAEDEEVEALRAALVVEPPLQRDAGADVLGEGFDAGERLGHGQDGRAIREGRRRYGRGAGLFSPPDPGAMRPAAARALPSGRRYQRTCDVTATRSRTTLRALAVALLLT